MRSCVLVRDINDEERKKEKRKEERKKERKKERKHTAERKKINPAVVETHVTVVTLEAISTNRLESKLVWKR